MQPGRPGCRRRHGRLDDGEAGEIGCAGAERKGEAAEDVGLRFFLAVFEMSDSVALQTGEVGELTDAEAAALASLAKTTKLHDAPPH